MHGKVSLNPGKVFLVGAGPGDPGLITVRGIECLRRADVVLYDSLVNRQLLSHSPPSAQRIGLGHAPANQPWSQAQINAHLVHAAREGKTVVRLKGGDPLVFGRSAEELEALTAAAIPFEIIPGVTAATGAAAYCGLPLTHGEWASAVALVAGHERHSKQAPPLDYASLAEFPGTLVFYMGVASARQWSEALLERGKPTDTPVLVIRRGTWSDQTSVRCSLGTVADVIAQRAIHPPAIVIVGAVAAMAPAVSWFAARPLFGTRVLVTRPIHQADALAELLAEQGAEVSVQPAIAISEPTDWRPVDRALEEIGQYDWLVFSSSNGVRSLLSRLLARHGDLRRLARARLAAIGPGTADELLRFHLRADVIPEEYRAEALAAALAADASGRRFLLVRASRGRPLLAEQLAAAGGTVDQIVAYHSSDVQQPEAEIAAAVAAGRVDWITVTSSAIAESLVRLFGESLRQTKLASISPVTSATLRQHGYEPAAEAQPYTMPGIVQAIVDAHN